MLEQSRSWVVCSGEVEKWLGRSPTELIKEMQEFGLVSSATREIISQMAVPDGATAQISITPVVPDMGSVQAEAPPLWVALAIFLDRSRWMKRMVEMGIRRIVVMHPEQQTKAGKGRLTISLGSREVEGFDGEPEQEVVWEISLTFSGGENLSHDYLAQAHEEASFFGVPLSQLGEKVVPQARVSETRTA